MAVAPLAVRVPASTSNVGAGFDCLGIALQLYLTVRIIPGVRGTAYRGTLSTLAPEEDLIRARLVSTTGTDQFRLEVTSEIPISRGLGSSAAAMTAAVALEEARAGSGDDRDAIFREVTRCEGHPDNAAPAIYGGGRLVVAGRARPRAIPIAIHRDLGIALAVPDLELQTAAVRALLPEHYPRATAVAQAGRAGALVLGLERGDAELIGAGMDDQLAVPFRADLIPGYREAVAAAAATGAYGATISGGGSTLVAVGPRDSATSIAEAMVSALESASVSAKPLTPGIDEDGLVITR